MSRSGRRYLPQDQVRREKIKPEYQSYLPKHFETELRAFVSRQMAHHGLKPEDVVLKLREVAQSWEMVNLQVSFLDEKK